ncbi:MULTISPECIES: glycoside hydrolase family 32 protein [unclassified Vibrio]|uniref:Sucrose-6-phosphate hydrolase n=1 Tax=Vibrio sp. HB236076 TaxID=3232307 RepID=A0AB39HFH0_9VIBR|nr:glycoside hydrolase family 32 protein [Vibrio sp. HB161653]MDP5255519.1 glycoside hydrolase family 32 protein [Vibrio sp. HB161653]
MNNNDQFINKLGGYTNIQRVLKTEQHLIFSLYHVPIELQDRVKNYLGEHWCHIPRTEIDLSKQQLNDLGDKISENFHYRVEDVCEPVHSKYRPLWHISPPQGLINDPNGFVYFNEQYHLFYQWNPFYCDHSVKAWAHLTSYDLINWYWHPLALAPSHYYDSHGVYSGHAIVHDEKLWLFYTGNTRIGELRHRQTTQCVAVSDDGIHFNKLGPVVDDLPPGATANCRDPKIVKTNHGWEMYLGIQTDTQPLQARLGRYVSKDLLSWKFDTFIGQELGNFGYMWECPDWFIQQGQTRCIIGPQGIDGAYPEITSPHHNRIFTVTGSKEQPTLSQEQTLDHGFDFYAPQTLALPDGRRVMIAWMGVPDEIDQASAEDGWMHQLTCVRELEWQGEHLYQHPLKSLENLRQTLNQLVLDERPTPLDSLQFELQVELQIGQTIELRYGQYKVEFMYQEETKELVFDRSKTIMGEADTIRRLALNGQPIHLRIFSDTSSLEVFINHGQFVMSGRIFVNESHVCLCTLGGTCKAQYWPLLAAHSPFNVSAP